jgi:predicted acyl esterase
MSDVANSGFLGPDGLNQAASAFPLLTETTLSEPLGLTYTSPPLAHDLLSAGPAALDLRLSSTAPETALWAVIADVWPDGSSHPVAAGRLLSAYPSVVRGRSLVDQEGDVVQPYGDYSTKSDATPLTARSYQVEFWPIGERFRRGDRIRLVILGASAASLPSLPAVNFVTAGGSYASRLLLPVLPSR